MRMPYLVIINDENSFVYTDKRKIKKIFNENENVKVYIFKTIDKYNGWKDSYELLKNGEEVMLDLDELIYTDLDYGIMEHLARAEWNSSIGYPTNGWHICSVCGDITNDIEECSYCNEFVCWDCSHEVTNNINIEGSFCSDDCFGEYGEQEYNIEYNPEKEERERACDRIEEILRHFEQEQLFNILVSLEVFIYDYDEEDLNNAKLKYKDISKKELLNILNHESSNDIYDILMELYESETDEYLSNILDGEAFINNLDPNDPADEWFFED